ncbi:MAG: SixA phosphatase family protein [Sphingosinicella sp.]
MKRLTLMRHASAAARSGEDFDRPLDDEGRRDAQAMGRALAAAGARFDAVLASPARRAVETLSALAEGLGTPLRPQLRQPLYLATAGEWLAAIQDADEAWRHLLLVGHNPAIASLAAMLSGAPLPGFPAGAVAEIALPGERWRDAGAEPGALVRFLRPGE